MPSTIPGVALDDRLQQVIARALPSREESASPSNDDAGADVRYERGFRDGVESLTLALQALKVDRALLMEAVTTALEAYGNNT